MNPKSLGDAIRIARMDRGLTQEQLAEVMNVAPVHIKNIEASRRKPSVPLLIRLMQYLNISVDDLVFGRSKKAPFVTLEGLSEEEVRCIRNLVSLMQERANKKQ